MADTHELTCMYCGADVTVSPGDNHCTCGATVKRTKGMHSSWHDEWLPPEAA